MIDVWSKERNSETTYSRALKTLKLKVAEESIEVLDIMITYKLHSNNILKVPVKTPLHDIKVQQHCNLMEVYCY